MNKTLTKLAIKEFLLNTKNFVFIVFMLVFSVGLGGVVPLLQGELTGNLSGGLGVVLLYGLSATALMIISSICQYFFLGATFESMQKLGEKLRFEVFVSLLKKPTEYHESQKTGEIVWRNMNFCNEFIAFLATDFFSLVSATLQFVFACAFLFSANWSLAIVLISLFALIFVILMLYNKKIVRLSKEYKETEMQRNSLILESINGEQTLVAYNEEHEQINKLVEISSLHYKNRTKFYFNWTMFSPLSELLWALATIGLIVLAYILTQNGVVYLFTVVSFLGYSTALSAPIIKLSGGLNAYAKTMGAASKVEESLTIQNENVGIKSQKPKGYKIELKNVSYFNDVKDNLINNISLTIEENEKVWLTGKHGSGKSTLAGLIGGMYHQQSGTATVGGVSPYTLEPNEKAKLVGIASDCVYIFDNTVENNIKFTNSKARHADVLSALELSSLNKFSDKLPQKEKTAIDEKCVSSGDKGLFGFARIILQNPKIVIIDELSRIFDERARKRFYKALNKFCEHKTLIYISSHENPEIKFDQIINLEN